MKGPKPSLREGDPKLQKAFVVLVPILGAAAGYYIVAAKGLTTSPSVGSEIAFCGAAIGYCVGLAGFGISLFFMRR
jgi:hypothetical protein